MRNKKESWFKDYIKYMFFCQDPIIDTPARSGIGVKKDTNDDSKESAIHAYLDSIASI